jgi:hypothetical protein
LAAALVIFLGALLPPDGAASKSGNGAQPYPLSLRADGSRERAPDDRLREAIHRAVRGSLDCFVACAPRNDDYPVLARRWPNGMILPALCTDQWIGYKGLDKTYPHATVDHAKHQYVVGAVHTQTIEGFWSIFKRGIVGSFHKVSAKYMPLYVAEFQFRYNNRFNDDIFGTAIEGV